VCVPAPACRLALAEATLKWPYRRRTSDGICPSAAHTAANPKSGHERGEAFDLSHDPANGCDAHALAERVMRARDERVLYVISNRRIWSRARYAEGWRRYDGTNPHTSHAHFELDPKHRNSTWPWWPPITEPAPPAPDPQMALRDSFEVDMVINTYDIPITTDGEGRGWHRVNIPRARIVGFTPPGVRPEADGRYVTAEVGFAEEGDGTVISVTEWAPAATAVVTISVLN
jgi:hypothetical protein